MNKQALLQYVDNKFSKTKVAPFRVGDTLRVHAKIKEGNTTRIQVFEGLVISFKGHGLARTFTVRKISFGVGVEKNFPMNSPFIEKVKVVRSGYARRAKLYYLRSRVGKASRLEEKESQKKSHKKSDKSKMEVTSPPSAELVAAQEK